MKYWVLVLNQSPLLQKLPLKRLLLLKIRDLHMYLRDLHMLLESLRKHIMICGLVPNMHELLLSLYDP